MRFRPGDRVVLARPNARGSYIGIGARHFGTGALDQIVRIVPPNSYILESGWSVDDDMLDPATPLSPFELLVNDYIRMELQP